MEEKLIEEQAELIDLDEILNSARCSCTAGDDNPY